MVEHSSPNATQSLPLEFDCDNAITDLASSTRDRTCEMPSSRGHSLLKKASFAIYADHFKRWRTDDYQCSQSSSQSPRRPSRQSSQSHLQPCDILLRRDELPDLLLAMLPTAAPAMNSNAPFVLGDISYSLLRASSAAFLAFSISRARASWRFISASSLAENSSQILTCSSTGLPEHRSSTSRASRSSICSYTARHHAPPSRGCGGFHRCCASERTGQGLCPIWL